MSEAISKEKRNGASILRLFFHDCFVNGCDASVLLDDTPNFKGEKSSPPNMNSLGGFEVIDTIKAQVEASCPNTVSCADILALAARDSVYLLGGPTWHVPLGRRDSRPTTNQDQGPINFLPSPFLNSDQQISKFKEKGLRPRDAIALSGAHTIGVAKCSSFTGRVNDPNSNIDPNFASIRQQTCPKTGNYTDLQPLDVETPYVFDNGFFKSLVERKGLLQSDQALFNGGTADSLVKTYSTNETAFLRDFVSGMIRMGNLVLTGNDGEIRLTCRKIN
ncbi:hypothetical protein LUZ60_004775 [Juncus effusus]|nr:hypothetical protein LUZ60_004775 [Juncus effusus]